VIGGPLGARLALGAGWLFLLGAIASSFAAQSQAAAAVEALAADDDPRRTEPGVAGAFALWLLLLGLVVIGVAALIA
jgi:hypothetical protein